MPIFLGSQLVETFGGTKNITGGVSLQEKTVELSENYQTVVADGQYDGLSKVNIPGISSNYIGSGIKKKSAQQYTPNNATQTIVSGQYLAGDQVINPVPTETKSISTNGTYTPTSGKFFSSVTVNVASTGTTTKIESSKTATPSETQQTITPSTGYDALGQVVVNAISSTYVGSGITRQAAKTVTPTKSEQTVVASGVYTTGAVKVGAIPSDYIIPSGSQTITENSTVDVSSLSEVVVNVPSDAPNYDTPSITVSTGGLITASANGKSNTKQLTTQASKTITPSESEQTAVATQTFTTGAVKVGAISTTYVGSGITKRSSTDLTVSGQTVTVPSGYYSSQATKSVASGAITISTPTISSTGLVTASATVTAGYVSSNPTSKTLQLTTQGAKTVTPSSSQQTAVAKGVYTTGDVVVSAVPTETTTINQNGTFTPSTGKYFNSVTVEIPIQHYYTGSATPSSSLGVDGDIYLKA